MRQKQPCEIAYLGPEGSFSHLCALKLSDCLIETPEFKAYSSILRLKEALSHKEVVFALFPLENSLGGSVPETLDALLSLPPNCQVELEWVLRIEHCLVGFGSDFSAITEIRAHFQAFAQCEAFLRHNFPQAKLSEWSSNSAAATSLLNLPEAEKIKTLAICSSEAANLYSIPVLRQTINDFPDNNTRFWLLSRLDEQLNFKAPQGNSQSLTSLAFRIPQDEPGGLMRVLAILAARDINLSKIESRPTKGRLCEYTFFIDFINPANWTELKDTIIGEISSQSSYFRFLGSYPVLPLNDQRFNSSLKHG